ncbi:Mdm33 family-domain-containing protein [Cercophora newfieldiana]|uniref:Sensitive to high expression protein 9, mitochondrial n=1 Tax=Cercophora newfieldiana TaxID=92897 RepID=A0AA39Y2Y4_9PEZI|nr:Mdm33 family-domain-containing protein [Cercophora newfieldiana]
MSPHTALRLAVRPLRGATLLNQLLSGASTASKTRRAFSQLPSIRARSSPQPAICLRCSIQVRARVQLYSTIPPYPPIDGISPKPSPNPERTGEEAEAPPAPAADNAQVLGGSQTTPEPSPGPPSEPKDSEPKETETEIPPSSPSPESSAETSRPKLHLPSYLEDRRNNLSARFSTFMDDLQTRILHATQTINDLTGYSAIETIKAHNTSLEKAHAAAQERLRAARHAYKALTSHRAATQREVTTLLARKDTWSPPDLERFTTLYRADHELEAQVANASAELTEAETDESRVGAELNAGILKRYHEEQIWSDGIRRQSTWGTWGLMGVNVLLFLVLQFVAEPWRRARLVKGVAEREQAVMDEVRRELGEVKAALEASGLRGQEKAIAAEIAAEAEAEAARAAASAEAAKEETELVAPVAEEIPVEEPTVAQTIGAADEIFARPWQEVISDPELIKAAARDLVSERRIDVRMRDVSIIALQSAVAGAAVVGSLAFVLLRSYR